MSWLALFRVLLELFGPWLQKWLDDLLSRAAEELKADPVPKAPEAIRALFGRAERLTWWPWKKRLLRECCKRAIAQAAAVESACLGVGPQPYLSRAEERDLAALVG